MCSRSLYFFVPLDVVVRVSVGPVGLTHLLAVQVRVTIAEDKGDTEPLVLCPGGGLLRHVRKDSTVLGSQDLILVLSNMNVNVGALYLLMEAMLAGLQKASDIDKNAQEEAALAQGLNRTFAEKNAIMADGEETVQAMQAVQIIEMNQNPLIGAGKTVSMKLMVQISHLAAGQHLLRLHLDRYSFTCLARSSTLLCCHVDLTESIFHFQVFPSLCH